MQSPEGGMVSKLLAFSSIATVCWCYLVAAVSVAVGGLDKRRDASHKDVLQYGQVHLHASRRNQWFKEHVFGFRG